MWNFSCFESNTAVIGENGEQLSYAELSNECNRFAKAITGRKLIFILCTNSIGSLIGYVASLQNKIVPLMLDSKIDKELLANFIQIYSPSYIWLPQENAHEFGESIIYCSHNYTLLKYKDHLPHQLYDQLALLLTTSGSTGSPKFVRQSYKNILANTESIVSYLKIDSNERAITTLPMNYTYGLSILNTHLAVGATIILTNYTLMQREFWTMFETYGATSFGGVPYTYEILDKLMFFRRKLPTLHTMTQAGGKLSPELHRRFAEYAKSVGVNFIVMYGQAEATARMAYLPAEKSLEKNGTMGIPIPGGKFTLIDTNDEIINEPEVVGELVYEGDNVTLGYAVCVEDLAKGDERNGVLKTGDMAKFDADGYYTIVGRKKRFLKIFGNRVNLDETERLIKQYFPYIDCACSGVDDAMKIFVTDKEYIQQVKKFIVEKTHLNFAAFNVMYLSQIPRNNSGKILYATLELL